MQHPQGHHEGGAEHRHDSGGAGSAHPHEPEGRGHSHPHHRGAHGHHHGAPGHHHGSTSQSRLLGALLLTALCLVVEAIGGLLAGSLALLADAGHMLTDCASLAMSYAAVRAGKRPATVSMSYGHHRWQVLAAFVNGLALLVLAAWIAVEAVQRLRSGTIVQGQIVAGVAVLGLLVNIAAFVVLSRGETNLNVRGALAHVMGDILGSLAALIAGAIIVYTGWMPADPLLSGIVAVIMARSGWRISRESAHILLEGAPADCDGEQIERALATSIPAVSGVHHLHVWSLTDERPVVTLHAVLRDNADRDRVLIEIQNTLRERFGVQHATVQIELTECQDDDCTSTSVTVQAPSRTGSAA